MKKSGIVMPFEVHDILELNQYMKLDKCHPLFMFMLNL